MKKTLMKTMFIGFTSLILFSCHSEDKKIEEDKTAEKKAVEKLAALVEDVIDLSRHPVNADYGNLKMGLSRYAIMVDSSKTLDKTIEVITREGVNKLKEKAMALAFESGYSGRYILAVKMTYGLNINNKLKLYYQPVLLKNVTNGSDSTDVVYDPLISGTFYKYTSSGFSEIDSSLVNLAANNYTTHISFKRDDNRYFRKFNNTVYNDSTGDVKSIIYSIQEMDSIMIGNSTDEIRIFNAAEEMVVRNKPYLKHSLLLGPGELKNHFVKPIFYLKYGNLSHLCPPSCNSAPKTFNIKLP